MVCVMQTVSALRVDTYINREFKIYDATVTKTSLKIASSNLFSFLVVREFKIYDTTVAKTSLKIESSSLSIFLVIREFKISDAGDSSENATNFAYLITKNKSFVRPSRALFISVHFFPISWQICDVK